MNKKASAIETCGILMEDRSVEVDGVEKIVDLYKDSHPFQLFSIIICHAGFLDVEYDSGKMRFNPHHVAILYPHHNIVVSTPSPDYRVTRIIVPADQLEKLAILNMNIHRFFIERNPNFELDKNQYPIVMDACNTLRHVMSLKSDFRDQMLDDMIMVFMGILLAFRQQNEGSAHPQKAYLSPRLFEAVVQNCHIHHDVDFYADMFCLSPKHFSTVIKNETGMPAGHWIRQIVVSRAKKMLISEPFVTIQNVSFRLGFADQTAFCRYFKRETGITPTDYRQGLKAPGSFGR